MTIPHKTAVIESCDEVDEVAERAGSVNTLVVREGRVLGSSTDGLAVTGAVECVGARVLLLGAGGAAQAVATAVMDAGAASIRVASRSGERAGALAARLHALYPQREVSTGPWPPATGDASLVVNATPVREEPLVDLHGDLRVVDLAYRPDGGDTALVAAARTCGCAAVVDGLEVLVRQGAASFERWTGARAPVEAMTAAVRA